MAEANEDNFEVEGITPERARQVIHAAREWVARRRMEEERAAMAASAAPDGATETPADGTASETAIEDGAAAVEQSADVEAKS